MKLHVICTAILLNMTTASFADEFVLNLNQQTPDYGTGKTIENISIRPYILSCRIDKNGTDERSDGIILFIYRTKPTDLVDSYKYS